ncbi:50S ribosomal protein L10 [candidate division WOR-3 bacterium]|nr:50S ribosomal protein L10 [candidate division WOR-3 bacterium]
MGVEEKKEIVKEVKEKFNRASCVCFTNYKYLTASRMSELRRTLKGTSAEMKVFKNRFILRALKENSLEDLSRFVEGPMALIFGYDDPMQPIKVIYDFKGDEDKPMINGGYLDGEIYDAKSFMELASIPSREKMYEKMIGSLSSPLNGMVYVLSGIPRKLISVLSLLAKQKEE